VRIVSIIAVLLLAVMTGCAKESELQTPPVYSDPTVSGQLPVGCQKTTIQKAESLLGQKLPMPTYMPLGYKIREVYYYQEPNSSPQVTRVFLMISDQPVAWADNYYTCRLVLEIGWHELGLGLKMSWAQSIPEVGGRLEDKDGEYVLWWEYGTSEFPSSTLRLYASNQFSREELVKIAISTLSSTSTHSQ
jgi:hypothetical protein